ncbi:MAG: hypothetical protein WD906_00910 [Anaerolineales bacterium]
MLKPAGYSGRSLADKLGLKPGTRVSFSNAPRHYPSLLGLRAGEVDLGGVRSRELDLLHLFVRDRKRLVAEFPKAKRRIKSNGSLWVSWPKLTSNLAEDLSENAVREIGLANGLVDVKVAAIDADWSGLKFVYRLKDRS